MGNCRDCPRSLVTGTAWDKASMDQRKTWKAQGIHRHNARGLCQPCYMVRSRNGSLLDAERWTVSVSELLAERELVCDPTAPLRAQARDLAPRVGMTFEAVERALYRAGVRSPRRLGGRRFKTEAA